LIQPRRYGVCDPTHFYYAQLVEELEEIMIEIALMIEGQDGLNWERWKRIAQAVEELGFVGLYRSDHFTNPGPPDKDSLELWVSLTWLASHTRRIEFGPMVSPVSFRDPVMTARIASQVDDLSGGRLNLGMGAGWSEREHNNYGYDLLNVPERFQRFEEGLQVVTQLLKSAEPVSFEGQYYRLKDAILLPRPQRSGGPPIVIGGNGPKRTLPLAAKFAQEWNGVYISPEGFAERNALLDQMLLERGRDPKEAKRSLMTRLVFGNSEKEARVKAEEEAREWQTEVEVLKNQFGFIIGAPDQIIERLKEYQAKGVQRIMLQWLEQDNLDDLKTLANTVIPEFTFEN
jgi:F420-dependent oxidoreductase-like protein